MNMTLRELTRCLSSVSGEKPATLNRQLRNWTDLGVLGLVGTVNTGTGRSRLYSRQSACVAALAVELARWGIPVGIMRVVCPAIYALLMLPKESVAKKIYGGSDEYLLAVHSPYQELEVDIGWVK